MLVHIYINTYARCLSFVLFAVCQRSSFTPSVLTCSKSKNRCARQCPSELGAALTGRFFSESECKGTAFFRTGKIFRQLFFRKSRKRRLLDKTIVQMGENGTTKGLTSHQNQPFYMSHLTFHILHLTACFTSRRCAITLIAIIRCTIFRFTMYNLRCTIVG